MSFFVERNIRTERLEITMITVNAMGDTCPIPVVKTKNAIKELNGYFRTTKDKTTLQYRR